MDNMATEKSVKDVRVNKLALILLTVIAAVIGLAPVALLLGRPRLLLYFAAGSAVIAVLTSFSLRTSATNSPSFLEFLLGGLGAIFPSALLGFLWIIVYGATFYATRLAELIVVWLGGHIHPNADLIAFYPTVVLASLLGIVFVTLSEANLADQIYLDETGVKTAFYDLFRQGRRRLMGCTTVALLFLGGALVLFWALGSIGTVFYILMELYLMAISGSLWAESAETKPREAVDAIDGIGRLFKVAGYQVERSPRTGISDLDSLLASLDLLAQKTGHNVFVDVRTTSKPSEPIDWRAGAELAAAARTLSKHRNLAPGDVKRLLVLADTKKPDPSLRALGKKEQVRILRVTSDDIRRVLEETDAEKQQEVARRLLQVLAAPSASPDSGESA